MWNAIQHFVEANYQWLFSGLGITAAGVIVWFLRRMFVKSDGSRPELVHQEQRGGIGSRNIQIGVLQADPQRDRES